jgi:penicillin amidase
LVNRGPFPTDGGTSAPNANGWAWSNPSRITGHVSMRMIVDFSDFNNSLAIHSTGQSGHPYHSHYDDMIQMWINGEYAPLRWGNEAIRSSAVETLTLQPAP